MTVDTVNPGTSCFAAIEPIVTIRPHRRAVISEGCAPARANHHIRPLRGEPQCNGSSDAAARAAVRSMALSMSETRPR